MKTSATELCRNLLLVVLFSALPAPGPHAGGDPSACDPGESPDVIVGSISQRTRFGSVGDVTGFSLGTAACNIGTCWMNSFAEPSNQHPVIAQNMFRLDDGRFEQIGQAWARHGFFALSQALCHNDCTATNGQHLGVHCSNPYSSSVNGYQPMLGPKFEVDPSTGFHPHPVTDLNQSGDAIYKRLQVHNDDLDPALNFGALYFVESQYVAQDDAAAGNQNNNASHRQVVIVGSGGVFDFSMVGQTVQQEPAISAWAANEQGVETLAIDVADDGRFILASKVTDLGGGVWHYEYAIHNLNSGRAGASVSVPIPFGSSPANIGFHDVEYHSGEPFDGTDWGVTVDATSINWSTEPFAVNPEANALRWGTLYNFRFDLDSPPVAGQAGLGLFVPGSPAQILVSTRVPSPCNGNGTCEPGESCACLAECPGEGQDGDGDQVGICADCNDDDVEVWATPGVTRDLELDHNALLGSTTLSWNPPEDPGATRLHYQALRSKDPVGFTDPATDCLQSGAPSNTWVTDNQPVSPGSMISYLVRAENGCPAGYGTLGTDSFDNQRQGRSCP